LGRTAGSLVLLADGLKGWAAVALLPELVFRLFGIPANHPHREYYMVLAGLTAVLGHNYTCWLKFKGGKGIATSAGVLGALVPGALAIILSLWIIIFLATRYVSLASLIASFALPFASWLTGRSALLVMVSACLGALAIYKHRPNIERLLKGTESRFVLSRNRTAEKQNAGGPS
jgi:glycerol-3-phosphate acyltransferase PlsY